ncbi:hypothetical protein Tco_1244854 [Tanacetum coccineum]
MWVDCVADTVVAEQWWGTSSALVIRVPVYSGPLLISNWGTFTIGMQTLLLKRVTSRAFFSLVRHFVAFLKSFVFIPLRGGLELDLDNSSLLSHEQFSGLVSAERHPPSPTDRKFYWKGKCQFPSLPKSKLHMLGAYCQNWTRKLPFTIRDDRKQDYMSRQQFFSIIAVVSSPLSHSPLLAENEQT